MNPFQNYYSTYCNQDYSYSNHDQLQELLEPVITDQLILAGSRLVTTELKKPNSRDIVKIVVGLAGVGLGCYLAIKNMKRNTSSIYNFSKHPILYGV